VDLEKIGKFILQLRQENNLSQKELAELIPVTRQAVSRWEKGKSIPDSSTLLLLSDIFNVSVNELLSGERLKKEEIQSLEKITLGIIDNSKVEAKKLKRIICYISLISFLLIFLFLIYYFITSYNSITVYKVEGKNQDFTMHDGILISTKQKIYLRLGKLIYNDNINIEKVRLYYKDNNENKMIFEDSDEDILITDYYGYNEYFPYEDITHIIKNLFLEIEYNNNKIKILQLKATRDFSNNKLFYTKTSESASKSNNILPTFKSELEKQECLISNIIKKSKKETDSYIANFSDGNSKITIIYFEDSNEIVVDVVTNDILEKWNYYLDNPNVIIYSEYRNDKITDKKYILYSDYKKLNKKEKIIIKRFKNYINTYILEGSNC